MDDLEKQCILILDFGSQYTQLIARCVRELGVYCEIRSSQLSKENLRQLHPKGIILSGGPDTVNDPISQKISDQIFQLDCPVLGICYGMQIMAKQLGGEVYSAEKREYGYAQVEVVNASKLLQGINDRIADSGLAELDVWMSHGDQVKSLPENFKIIASTINSPIAAMANENKKFYGLQFHPEVSHTPQGKQILKTFLFDICDCQTAWTTKNIIAELVQSIRETVKNDGVLLGLSGGVDSSVLAALLQKAIGKQLTCVFVDTGLLRINEAEQVKTIFKEKFAMDVLCVQAQEKFYAALAAVVDPEKKRKIIGKTFIDVFDAQAKKIPDIKWLAQGTIYSDVIESAATKTGQAQVIKSHHNVGGLPKKLHLKLLEPLRTLFKDEVRKIGMELGLPYEIVHRHPFPGPGLGVRILGEVKAAYVEKLSLADAILIEELHKSNLYYKVSQAFTVFLPIKSVGVTGDARHYDHVLAIRIVESTDFMTARFSHVPYEFLETVSHRIINEVPGISRVTYDISNKPPATIEWE